MPSKAETIRGQRWEKRMASQGLWVQKLHGSVLSGIPDYLVGRPGNGEWGLQFVEAKTLDAVLAKGCIPAKACSRAQCYFLDMVQRCVDDGAGILILAEDRYVLLDWLDARKLWRPELLKEVGHPYHD